MSQKTISVLYNGIENKLEINLEETNTYELLMMKMHSIITDFNPSLTYNLMTINTSEPYTLLDSDNYMKIMKEEIAGDNLKLFLNKINIDSIDNSDNLNDAPSPLNNNVNSGQDEDEDDDDFIIEQDENNKNENKEEIKEEKENNNIINEEKNKKENNNIINKENESKQDFKNQLKINEANKNSNLNKLDSNESGEIINNDDDIDDDDNLNSLNNQTNIMLDKIKLIMGDQNSLIYKHSKTVIDSSNNNNNNINNINNNALNYIYKENDKNDDYLENKNNEQENKINENNALNNKQVKSNLIKPDTFKSIKCSLCKDNLSEIKYICCVCENCILCTKCESEHFHPCIKFKSPFLSNLSDIYKFISHFYSFKIPSNNFFSKIFKKEYDISLVPLTDKKICLRPEKEVLLPIKIANLSKELIRSSQIEIIPKDNKLVQIYAENKKFSIGPNSPYTYKMKCIAGEKLGKESIYFYGFSETLNFKSPEKVKFNLVFEINNDDEEEKMNEKLGYNENVILYNKEHKQLALNILESIGDSNRSKEHINNVFNILITNKFDKQKSINMIKSLKK